MTTVITDLPCEIIAQILEKLDHVERLISVRLVCRHFDASFRENKTRIVRGILQTQIPPESLPYAIALVLDKPSITSASLNNLLQTIYEKPKDLQDQLDQLPITKLYSISRTHEVISSFVAEFSKLAWNSAMATTSRFGNPLPDIAISSTEHLRFSHAFYRVELFLSLFGQILKSRGPEVPLSDGPVWFYGQHNPWECHQILAAYEFLDRIVENVSNRLAKFSCMSPEGAAMFHQFSMAEGVKHIRRIREMFPPTASSEAMAALFDHIVEEPWLDPFSPRHNCDLSGYSDHNDSLMTGLPRSNPEYFDRDKAIRWNWTGAYRHRQGIPDEVEMSQLRRSGFVFWDEPSGEPSEGRELSPIWSIFLHLASQAEESDGSDIDYDDISDDDE